MFARPAASVLVTSADFMLPDNSGKLLIVVMGVSGTGKSTLGRALAEATGMPFIDGDDLHPQANVDKMASGRALTDADREPWLVRIRTTAERMSADPEEHGAGLVVACSALRRRYRDILRGTVPGHAGAQLATHFVYIREDEGVLQERMAQRRGHFMKANMLESQISTLENPEGEKDVVPIPLTMTTKEQVAVARRGLAAMLDTHNL